MEKPAEGGGVLAAGDGGEGKGAGKVVSDLNHESMKAIAEGVGLAGLPQSACTYLAEDVTYRMKLIVQVRSDTTS